MKMARGAGSGHHGRRTRPAGSRMDEDGAVFADEGERDHIRFDWRRWLTVAPVAHRLGPVTG
ncbi:hypothetical protein TZ53_04910 [Sphingobium sp. YBL2]|nr:hypothetical protein TZ53_04910 [Sphingobium sp. YBL2]PNP96189.1 hypothetical protein A8G00_23375 [Sphingobium sp. SA916]